MNFTPIDIGIRAASPTSAVSSVTVMRPSPPDAVVTGTPVPATADAADAAVAAVEAAAARMEEHARSVGRSLQFRVDESSGRVVVSVRDHETGELIRQIPSESVLKLARELGQAESGTPSLIIDGQA